MGDFDDAGTWRGYLGRLQFGHGGDAVGDWLGHRTSAPVSSLQFGHGGDAVGDEPGGQLAQVGFVGFNSATAVTPWVTREAAHAAITDALLQFGHGGDAVGDVANYLNVSTGRGLQFGHGGDAVGDCRRDRPERGAAVAASIRPRR